METAVSLETSQPFLGRWQLLVSTTNWEKGQIITSWRNALQAEGVDRALFTDEAWSQLVGNVTPQHVGRLRRVYERFGETRDQYAGLFWSHFQAALDWNDAEMWLEGAVQNRWSISQMRGQRAETLGEVTAEEPSTATDWDVAEEQETNLAPWESSLSEVQAIEDETTSFDEPSDRAHHAYDGNAEDSSDADPAATILPVATIAPLANLPSLPSDLAEAFDHFKLCILRQKAAGWEEISCESLLASLDALKELALAPGGEE